jgi:hypothetical protein
MCLETHFQYEFSILGCFGKTGLKRKKNQTAMSFEASFFMFSWAKKKDIFFLNTLAYAMKSYMIKSYKKWQV